MRSLNLFLSALLTPVDRLLSRLIGKGFGLKDVFTLINLAGGTAGIYLAFVGRPVDASWAVLLGFILGDSLDGYVARLTGHSNRFGSDFDTITDHLAQGIAPAFIVYAHLAPASLELGLAMAFLLISAGSVRHARNTAVSFDFKFCWKGLPRPIAAMLIFSLYNSRLVWRLPEAHWWLAGVTVAIAAGLLTDFPFVSHHGRRLQRWVVGIVLFAYVATIAQALVYRRFVWEFLFLSMTVYVFLGWIIMHPEERAEFRRSVRRWRDQLEDRTTPTTGPTTPKEPS